MDNPPRISIITPSFNSAGYIEGAIKSVLAQGYANFEHIVIDNCSTDGTIEILKKYPHLVWVSESDEGYGSAVNRGFKKAKGDIIGWLNSDEYYHEDCFNQVVQLFLRHPDTDFLYGEYEWVDAQGKFIRRIRNHGLDKKMMFFYGGYTQSCASFLSRRIIDQGDFIDESLKLYNDKEYFLRLAVKGYKFRFAPLVFASFTLRKDAISRRLATLSDKENDTIWKLYAPYFTERKISRYEKWMMALYFRLKHNALRLKSVFQSAFYGT